MSSVGHTTGMLRLIVVGVAGLVAGIWLAGGLPEHRPALSRTVAARHVAASSHVRRSLHIAPRPDIAEAPALAIPQSVTDDESLNHRVRIDPGTGKVLAVRRAGCAEGQRRFIAPRALDDLCGTGWTDPDLVYSDDAVEIYAPQRDLNELLAWHPTQNWWRAPAFGLLLYNRMKQSGDIVQQNCVVDFANHTITIASSMTIRPDGEAASANNDMPPIRVDLIEATDENRPMAWVASHIVHELADKQAMALNTLGVR